MTVTIAITIATIGRLMKKSEITAQFLSFDVGPGVGATNGFGLTTRFGLICWMPSTTTRSPGFRPPSMIHIEPLRSPTVTGRMLTVLAPSTTATW